MKEVKPETEMEVDYILSLSGSGLLSREDRWCLEEAGALTGMMEAKLAVAASSRADHYARVAVSALQTLCNTHMLLYLLD